MNFFKNGKQKSFRSELKTIADKDKREKDYQDKLKLCLKEQQEEKIKELKSIAEERLLSFLQDIKETIAENKGNMSIFPVFNDGKIALEINLDWDLYSGGGYDFKWEEGKTLGFLLEENLLIKIHAGRDYLKPGIILGSPNWENKVERLILSLINEGKHCWSK